MLVYRSSMPHIAVLGRLPNTRYYRNIERFPKAIQNEEILIVRFDAPLFFGNASTFRDRVLAMCDERPALRVVILDAVTIHELDSSGVNAFEDVLRTLKKKKIELYLAEAIGPVRDQLYRTGTMQKLGEENQFMYVDDAVKYFESKNTDDHWNSNAIQTNLDPTQI